jgi:signal transduction histidine kinase
MLEDISEQKQAEARMRDYQESLRAMALELSLTEARERRRLAIDLHDQVGQILALAQLKMSALQASASAKLAGPLEDIRRLLGQTISYTRSKTFELSSPILYDFGFEAGVEWLGELLQEQYGLRLQVVADRTPKPLDDEIQVLLFQLVRELLGTVIRRAKPNQVVVLIHRDGQHLLVQIDNDGANLDLSADPRQSTPDGLGLFSIRERLKYLGGHLEVQSAPERGTRVTMTVPLKY